MTRYLLSVVVAVSCAQATSIVFKVQDQRVVIAADTLADKLDVSSSALHEDQCKIAPLGRAAFAVAGYSDYKRIDSSDQISDWDAISDAKAAQAAHGQDIQEAADDWAARAVQHYTTFFFSAPLRVRALANINPQHVLVIGAFVGWGGDKAARLIFEYVYLDDKAPIQSRRLILPSRDLPYTTNAITQELIEGHSERTEAVATRWKTKLRKLPKAERVWRWLEFIITATSQWDKTVAGRVDVLEVDRDGHVHWLQNFTCPD